ncbi:ubiquitin carboxyl-terminal hydrolase CYLD [Lampris incognitus]|uniref:ubiquitin carboxyl-terminal hydrolase CYLD n=1 Tax=Lampris incognitus TaxID=2546036 RepID=UPI0024B55C82|nr:ubiquitin carboxyl-terminal hydrolase CYLD [Lampris incognitus]XP_056131556.1 ubiquitin carboxyl-terminal hydrolase CYLD [Lampris incognitus]XP_056131557.1 ubiquitin carboxyl-terminal hydrolase CYLD [Lampris incognitus]XP_056131558.1 ubiquitin carboxyl-terminal hydrolase CYLD [Lampris incognitus]XP_056131560.1 ubiquitin carboxyl-terminal hydrolase CYLD [Lampris incognitus]XP_056131561.1 ubiquitin carboxyl-terminal hydrolase CYLD [Lampris incognitus]
MALQENLYFIITKKSDFHGSFRPGRLCYIPQLRYASILRRTACPSKLPVICIGSSLDDNIEVHDIEEVSEHEANLLQALDEDSERLKWFEEKVTLREALELIVNTPVTVTNKQGNEKLRGIIRYIGKLSEIFRPIPGVFFGIELQGPDKGKGQTDGTYARKSLFSCKKNCGIFVPFTRVRPTVPSSLSPSVLQPTPQTQTDHLALGDRMSFSDYDSVSQRMGMDLAEKVGHQYRRSSTDTDKDGRKGGEIEVPLSIGFKEEEQNAGPYCKEIDSPLTDTHHMDLSVNSLVEVTLATGNAYGIIRWIGKVPGREETMAGLELEDNKGVSDGTFKNERFFICPSGKALFLKLLSCRPDSRFQTTSAKHFEWGREHSAKKLESVAPISSEQVKQVLIGRMKGIQGHCNSCYMDAALFSLFSCTSVLDSLLFKSTESRDAPIQNTLLHDIVNPLRSKGFVEGRHIMKLRQQLQEHGYSNSFTTDEKDPEEFLTVIMHHILTLDPLLKLSAGGKVQESFYYQIFLDQNHSLILPTVQQLIEHSFHNAGLKLAEVPSCLILQMPRFGKKFKMFEKIVPSLELDITDLLSEGPQQCMLCGQLATEECMDCFKEPVFGQTGFKLFCKTCSSQVHCHPQRRSHQTTALEIPQGFQGHAVSHVLARDKLELFAVLCIETSHYVSFLKHGPNNQDWIFFDSMADRQGEKDGFNIPQVQACPEVGVYLEMSPVELANQVPRDMKGVAKRLFCDAYMYLYQSTSMCLYR